MSCRPNRLSSFSAGQGVTVVGDDAQSIYSFRRGQVRNILDLPDVIPAPTSSG